MGDVSSFSVVRIDTHWLVADPHSDRAITAFGRGPVPM